MEKVIEEIIQFQTDRNWKQFHTPSNLAKSIVIEASELLECFQWSDDYDLEHVKEELADVMNYCLLMAQELDLNIEEIILDKIAKNKKKYPVDKSFGNSEKYNKL